MESLEVFLYTFLVSHYIWNIVFVSWLLSSAAPPDHTYYGLLN